MIIDFERINYLTSHPLDDPKGQYKTLIKEYVDIVVRGKNDKRYKDAYDTLRYNKIILDQEDIRDYKINEILDN